MHRAFGMDFSRLLDLVCDKIAGKKPKSEEDRKYLERVLALPRREERNRPQNDGKLRP